MKVNSEKGFSLIELLLVVVIVGLIAAIAVPNYQKGIRAAENGTALGTLRTISSAQVGFYSSNNRFGRLSEINSISGHIGTVAGDSIVRGNHVFVMTPPAPRDADLRDGYVIRATRGGSTDTTIYMWTLNQTGQIEQVFP